MEWREAKTCPESCKNCTHEECYNCDVAGERWALSPKDELRARRALMVRAMDRLQRKIVAIDMELGKLENK